MYAVIESGGKQYRVAVGDRLRVETLDAEPGSTLTLDKVLLVGGGEAGSQIGTPHVATEVEARVVGHGRGPKVIIFKLRRRQNSRTRGGHRQNYTELEITRIADVTAPAPKPAAAGKPKKKASPKKAAPGKKTTRKKASAKTGKKDADK